ncbi:DUF1152 domain-containing protein [Pseudofrankia sp. BMG5.37]|uniref:DUF1152 domain-containing protein n=1 Tax=Pseudofrankia sp. BMG5.37 TaxID=3050035 RepID=UPI002893C474|nr:DUF1152 domain-containing protein [Pseudofrankia sp. BMG5.37]MDT3439015.1 DUF1152 domain-containing protein [Pseudofrankia sp. BMG5.37]
MAAGGGGDALAAAMVHRALRSGDPPPVVLTYAWERLRVDPLPGPRGPEGFTGLLAAGRHSHEITPASDTVPAGRSMLPRLAGESSARLILLDPAGGAGGLHRQLAEQIEVTAADEVWIVDVGGDVMASGHEPGLRSPLADGLVAAAALGMPVPVKVLAAGPGLDGELSETEVLGRVAALGGRHLTTLTRSDVEFAVPLLAWHPSEVTALLVASALGIRGRVEIRDQGLALDLGPRSAEVHVVGLTSLAENAPYVAALADTTTLDEAEEVIRRVRGFSEIDYERKKAAAMRSSRSARSAATLLREAEKYCVDARARGVAYLAFRRLAEVLDVSPGDIRALHRQHLVGPSDTDQPQLPLWPTS